MGLESKAGFVGLVTATSEVTAGGGALRIADNVSLRKEGALVLRAHFGSTALSRAYRAAFPYRGVLYYLGADNNWYNAAQAQILYSFAGLATQPPPLRADSLSAKEARNNLYLPCADGVYKVTALSDTYLQGTGLPVGNAGISLAVVHSSGTLFGTNQQAAYRAVAKRTDANGLVVRSRPTGAALVASGATSGAGRVDVYFSNVSGLPTGLIPDEVEVYRTRLFPAGVQIDDEFQLVGTVSRSQFNWPSVPAFSFIDEVPDTARGTTLYTSPSRGGAENANDRPPAAACIERFRGSLFFGNTVGPSRLVLSWKHTGSGVDSGNRTGSATGIGYRTATGNITNGSTSITSVSNTTGVQVGQFVQSGGQQFGVITAIAGTTITTSSPVHIATAAGAPLRFDDAISVSVAGVSYVSRSQIRAGMPPGSAYYNTSVALNAGVVNAYELTPAIPGYTETLVIERYARGGAQVEVRASHGNEMSPPIALGSAATGTFGTNDVLPHGLAWSEPDEPEHVPPKNFARVGDAGKAILALIATKDRLLIFKEDGLFMLVGNTAKDFGIYPLDTTALCILPGSVKRLQNTVYALTNLGLIAVDEGGGVNIVSRPIQTELAPIVTAIRLAAKSNGGLYYMPGLTGVTGTADDPNGEYWMMLGTTSPSFGGQILVYNAFRQGFTTYSFGTPTPGAVAQDGEGQPLVLTASTLLTPSTSLGAITARISPRAFSDPALVGKLWTHVVAGFSRLTGTTSITARFSSSESMVDGTTIDEVLEAPTSAGLVQLPAGSLMRHPVPRAMARAFLSFVELVIAVSNGTFTLELMGMEARENIPNKRPTHGTGST